MDESDAELFTKHAEELMRFAATLVGPTMAEDVMVNGVLSAFAAPAWRTVAARRAYLYRTVLNEARQLHRSDRRRVLREVATAATERVDDSHHVRIEVLDAMRALSLRQRAVVFLAYWSELPAAEIGRFLGLSTRTVERSLTTARRRLEEMLR